MTPFDERLHAARNMAADRRIRVTDVEDRLGTRFTVDTIMALTRFFPEKHFVWLMGADNLKQFPQWRDWRRLFTLVPIAVFDRAPYSFDALAGKAAQAFSRFKLSPRDAPGLVECKPPAWVFFHTRLHPGSATMVRARRAAARKGRRERAVSEDAAVSR